MSQQRYSPAVYAALRQAGMSNRQIARELGVNESSVRRAVKGDTEPRRRVFTVTIEEQT